ncbi:MAG: NEW3 domain-containing protein, partial [Chloroflexota bacterium]|nr:NEW3 domain-containing protein [Chloroflexota bacterium]
DQAWRRAWELSEALSSIVYMPEEAGFALDPGWASIYPYQLEALAGEEVCVNVRMRNYSRRAVLARVSLSVPDNWSACPDEAAVQIMAGGEGQVEFALQVSSAAAVGRHVVCADITLESKELPCRHGQAVECLVQVVPEERIASLER